MPIKADNDMESSDLNFSEEHDEKDEHEYQIEQLGDFEAEAKSLLSEEYHDVVGNIKDEQSVDFSEGGEFNEDFSDDEPQLEADKDLETNEPIIYSEKDEHNDEDYGDESDESYSYYSDDSSFAN